MLHNEIAKIRLALKPVNWQLVAGLVVFSTLSFMAISKVPDPAHCDEIFREDSVVILGDKKIGVEIADDEVAKNKGLGDRACLPINSGMLFSFPEPGLYLFWMKDMRFPLDIVWLDENRKVITVKENINPRTYPQTFTSDQPAQYVLELNAGKAKEYGITLGAQLTF